MQQLHILNVMYINAILQTHNQPVSIHRHVKYVFRIFELANIRSLFEVTHLIIVKTRCINNWKLKIIDATLMQTFNLFCSLFATIAIKELEKSRSTILAAGSLEKISSTLSTPERENSLKELLLMTDRELRRQEKRKKMKFCEGKSHPLFLVSFTLSFQQLIWFLTWFTQFTLIILLRFIDTLNLLASRRFTARFQT